MRDLDYVYFGQVEAFCVKLNNPREYEGLMDYLHGEGYTWVSGLDLKNPDGSTTVNLHRYTTFAVFDKPDDKLDKLKDIYMSDEIMDRHKAVGIKEFFKTYAEDPYAKLLSVLDKLERTHEED